MFSLTVLTINGLVIEAQADANFPFETPLCVQALDANSRVITDGPDSTLVKILSFFPCWYGTIATTMHNYTLLVILNGPLFAV